MKVWVKLLIGSILGMTIGFLLPEGNETVASAFEWLGRLALGIGRYAVVPVLFFSLTIAVYELRKDEQFWPVILKNFILIVSMSAVVIFLGIIVTTIFSPGRIPIERTVQFEPLGLDISANILEVFPANMFSVLAGDGIYLFPIYAFAFFLGMALNFDKTYTKSVISLIDSLSRIFYHVAVFFSEILGFILIVLAAYWAVRFRYIMQTQAYTDLIVTLGVFAVVLCFVILPLSLYLFKIKSNPWRILYGFLGPAFASFFSGDVNFSIPVLQRHTKENFGVRRRSGSLSITLFSTFCRAGSAVVAATAFIVIIRSYSYLRIAPTDLFFIGFQAFIISFLLARHPGTGAYVALAALCLIFSGGEYRTGYLILKPLAFYLIAVGTFIDVMLNAFGTFIIARTNGFVDEKNIVRFI